MGPVLALTLVLNLVDLVATLFFVEGGYAVEANPLMARLLELGAAPFALGKLLLVTAGVLVLWRYRARLLSQVGSVAVCAVYASLGVYHAVGVLLR